MLGRIARERRRRRAPRGGGFLAGPLRHFRRGARSFEQRPGDHDGDAEQQRRHGDEQRILQRLGKARNAGRARQRDDLRLDRHGAAIGADAVGFEAGLQTIELGALRLGDGFELAQLHLVVAGADHLLLHLVEALAHRGLTRGGDGRALLDALDDLADFALDLALQTFEVGAQLAHARVRREQRRRQLGELALDAHALLHEVLDERRALHVRQQLGVAGADHLAHRLRACVRFAAGRLRFGQLGRDVAELLLVEAGIVGAALEDVGLRAEVLDRLFGVGDFLHELVDLRLQRLLHVVGRTEGARRQQRAIGLGQAVGDRRGELRVNRGKADADDAAVLGRVDLETLKERLEDAILLALLVDVAEIEGLQQPIELARRAQRAVEFRIGGELFLGNDLQREIGRLERPQMRVDGFLVEARGDGLERALAAVLGNDHLDLRFRCVARRECRQDAVGDAAGNEAQQDQLGQRPAQRTPDRGNVDVVGGGGIHGTESRSKET